MRLFFVWIGVISCTLHAQDRVHLTDGRIAQGRILNLAKPLVSMELKLQGAAGSAKREFPADLIDFIDFAPLPGEAEALANPADAKQQERLLELWREKSVNLGWPTNNAGDIGLALADQLLKQSDPDLIDRAFRIYSLLEKDDWDPVRRARGQRGRLRCLIALKRIDEAIFEARAVARASEDPELLIEANQVLAMAEFEKLRRFEDEHPRWDQDDDLTETRTQLYQQTLDQLLHTPLFHGSVENMAAESLWQVVQLHQFAKEIPQALSRAKDLAQLYPKTPQTEQAQQLLETVKPKEE